MDVVTTGEWKLTNDQIVESASHAAKLYTAYEKVIAAGNGVEVKDLKAPAFVSARAAVGVVNMAVSLYTLDAEIKTHGGITPDFLLSQAQGYVAGVIAQKVASGVMWVASANPLGAIAVVGAGSYFAYQAIKDYARELVANGEPGSDIVFYAEFVLAVMEEFEREFAPQIELFAAICNEAMSGLVEPILEDLIPEIVTVGGDGAGFVFEEDQWLVGAENAFPIGDDADNVLIHDGHGEVRGGAGGDVILGWTPDIGDANERLTLNGEDGDDWIFVIGGDGAIVYGGEGRDLLMNWSHGGETYGGTPDGPDTDDDTFLWTAGQFIMDAQPNDRLSMFGIPLVGGTNLFLGDSNEAYDWLLPFVRYGKTTSGQLIVSFGRIEGSDDVLSHSTVVNNFDEGGASDDDYVIGRPGDLGMIFRICGDAAADAREVGIWGALWGHLITYIRALEQVVKGLNWQPMDDPLVLDLDGDGVETTDFRFDGVLFDFNFDLFAERVAWVKPDDGFLVWDRDGDGRIRDVSEMFGSPGVSGFAELAALDENGDGVIDALDPLFGALQVWRDLNRDGLTDAGELATLAETGIVSLSLDAEERGTETAAGNLLRAASEIVFEDRRVSEMVEVIFDSETLDGVYRGLVPLPGLENGVAAARWTDSHDLKGCGRLADLAVAASNEPLLKETVERVGAAMTVPDLQTLREQAREVFSLWAAGQVRTAELTPVLLAETETGPTLVDWGVWDDAAGFWRRASGSPVRDGTGALIPAPTLEDVLASRVEGDGAWVVEQTFSPGDRGALPAAREARPYLVEVEDGRPVVRDWGVFEDDASGGFWRLASGAAVLDAGGAAIDRPTLADVLAQDAGAGRWTEEAFGANPFEALAFDRIAVRFIDGRATDYSVQMEDEDGPFQVWATNLRRAMELEGKSGVAGGFSLRSCESDLDNLKDLDNSPDSRIRAELLTADELRFAMASLGTDFRPELLVAGRDEAGFLTYVADIAEAGDVMAELADSYLFQSRAYAVRLAMQGGLAEFFEGVRYDPAADAFPPTTDRMLTPLVEKLLQTAPEGRDAAADWLTGWAEILEVVYSDYLRNGGGARSERWLFQMLHAASENVGGDVELLKLADIFGVDEDVVRLHGPDDALVEGTDGTDFFVIGEGAETVRGGARARTSTSSGGRPGTSSSTTTRRRRDRARRTTCASPI